MAEPCYKVVQVKNKGDYELIAVPFAWETNGKLKWPRKNSTAIRMLKDINSVPLKDWEELQCVVKRPNMPTLHAANAAIDGMLDTSNTSSASESSDRERMPPPKKIGRPPKRISASVQSNNADASRNDFNAALVSIYENFPRFVFYFSHFFSSHFFAASGGSVSVTNGCAK